jgi:plastocyanin
LPLLHVGTTGLPLLGGAALGQAKRSEEIDGTAANQWRPAQVTIKPGGTVTFRIAGGQTHSVRSGQAPPGTGGSTPPSASPHITKVGDACTVRFPKAGTYPFFCQVLRPGHEGRDHRRVGRRLRADHRRQCGRQQRCPGHHAEGGGAPVGRPAGHLLAGWGLFAVGALLALMLIALYVRFTPGFNRQKRLEEEGGSPASHCQQGSPLRA